MLFVNWIISQLTIGSGWHWSPLSERLGLPWGAYDTLESRCRYGCSLCVKYNLRAFWFEIAKYTLNCLFNIYSYGVDIICVCPKLLQRLLDWAPFPGLGYPYRRVVLELLHAHMTCPPPALGSNGTHRRMAVGTREMGFGCMESASCCARAVSWSSIHPSADEEREGGRERGRMRTNDHRQLGLNTQGLNFLYNWEMNEDQGII